MENNINNQPPPKGRGCCGTILIIVMAVLIVYLGKTFLYDVVISRLINKEAVESEYAESDAGSENDADSQNNTGSEDGSGSKDDKASQDNPFHDDSDVTIDNIRQHFGYGDETVVLDMSGDDYQANEALVAEAFKDCPERILLWDNLYATEPQNHKYMHAAFWVDNISLGETFVGDTPVTVLEPLYLTTDQGEIARMQAEIDASAGRILSMIPEDADYWTRCKVIHDELIRTITYDKSLEKPYIYGIYGALVTGDAVCQGYAYAFSYLMDKCGYNCETVISESHAWNFAVDPGKTLDVYIDVTWDDPDFQDSNGNDYIKYDHFFITKEEVLSIDSHNLTGSGALVDVSSQNPESYNYHRRLGYCLDSYSYDAVVNIFAGQNFSDGRLSTVRFTNDEAWQAAPTLLEENGQALVNAYCDATGYYGSCYFWTNDTLRIMNISRY